MSFLIPRSGTCGSLRKKRWIHFALNTMRCRASFDPPYVLFFSPHPFGKIKTGRTLSFKGPRGIERCPLPP